jgi:thiol-disulfide isomerase/thioredoxin
MRLAGILIGLAAGWIAAAQSSMTPCDAPASVAAAVDRARDPMLPFAARMELLERLLDRNPDDIFAGRAYLSALSGYSKVPLFDRTALPRIEKQYRENPASPGRIYLYALAIARRDPAKSEALLKQLTEEHPDSPWPHLARAKQPGIDHLEKFAAICPATLDGEALDRIATGGSASPRASTAARLRKQIAGRPNARALAAWPQLWQLEFQLTPESGHGKVRDRIRQDVADLTKLLASEPLLDALRQGYRLLSDAAANQRIAEELSRDFPKSRAAAVAAIDLWSDRHPAPLRNATEEERLAYIRKRLGAATEWVARWPNHEAAWIPMLDGFMKVEELRLEDPAALAHAVLDCMERNPDFTLGFTDQAFLNIAERLAKTGTELELVPRIVTRGLDLAARRFASDMASRRRPLSDVRVQGEARIQRELAHRILVLVHMRTGREDAAARELEALRREVAGTSEGDLITMWRGFTRLMEAALDAGRKDVARETLARMHAAFSAEKPENPRAAIDRSLHESSWWEARAQLAEAESRTPDAAIYYWRAAEATPSDDNPALRRRLVARAETTWKAAGGSPEALSQVQAPNPQASRWTTVDRPMPALDAMKPLAGKTVFLNVWATWCGPCQAELPFVERIFRALAGRDDVRVVTLNMDENPGLVEPYIKQRGFTFPVILARDYLEGPMKVESIPRNWIVDAKGMLRLERQGGADDTFVTDVLAAVDRIAKP